MQPPTEQLVDKESKAEANKLETTGNETTMNLNNIVYQNIQSSPYFKSLYEFKTYHEIIDEVYNRVESLGTKVSSNNPYQGTTASSAFCLLYKLWTLRLTVKQINGLLNHPDSPYIRGLGLLYLRYVCKPVKLWDWFEPFLDDREEIVIQNGAPANSRRAEGVGVVIKGPSLAATIAEGDVRQPVMNDHRHVPVALRTGTVDVNQPVGTTAPGVRDIAIDPVETVAAVGIGMPMIVVLTDLVAQVTTGVNGLEIGIPASTTPDGPPHLKEMGQKMHA
ncbi:hypothetical protein H4R33_005881 [Dimargaris cristalligena]|nr:hypothetical protein H4R33_005881 [Dimargaris cristalligena]